MSSQPVNEPILGYAPGSPERAALQAELDQQMSEVVEIPCIINGQKVFTGNTQTQVIPHKHGHVIANVHIGGKAEIEAACQAAIDAQDAWIDMGLEARCAIFEKCAELLIGDWRMKVNASTMLNQSKTAFQAEIDSACELIDFWNFNCYYARQFHDMYQPLVSPSGVKNSTEIRPLEGFVLAITPFNFSSIAANLPSAPALMGNVAIWKPASSTVYPAYFIMKLFKEAGLPDGVINFIPGRGSVVGPLVMDHPNLAGVHFTGSTSVFQNMWEHIGGNIKQYASYPRIVGETGGKDFCIAHESVNKEALVTAMVRGAYEFQGQKCSAMSRAYIPSSIWSDIEEKLLTEMATITMGDPSDFSNFMNAVIDKNAFDSIKEFIDDAANADDAEIIFGGKCDDSIGYFIEPTIIITKNPMFRTMCEEIFGPVLTIYIYDSSEWKETLKLVDSTSPYALTGCVMANDTHAIAEASGILKHAAGNFYINDKPTGAVVGQQPFGGSRASGTNDKAGSMFNLARWVSQRTIKENFDPPTDYRYPFMEEK